MKYRREQIDPPDGLLSSDEDESRISTAADLAAAYERGRREGRQDIKNITKKLTAGGIFAHDMYVVDADLFNALLRPKEARE